MHRFAFALILLCGAAFAQEGRTATSPMPAGTATEEPEVKLPNGRSRNEAILREDHARNLKDAADLTALSQSLQADLEKEDRHVLSLQTLKKLDEIDKLTRRMRARMRRF